MSPKERGQLQESIFDAVRTSVVGGRPSQSEIAAAAGCDRTEISRFAAGARVLDLDELVGLMDTYGADVVLAPLASRFGFAVVPAEDAPGTSLRELPRSAARLTRASAELTEAAAEALADGVITDDEAESLNALLNLTNANLRRVVRCRVRAGRAG